MITELAYNIPVSKFFSCPWNPIGKFCKLPLIKKNSLTMNKNRNVASKGKSFTWIFAEYTFSLLEINLVLQ